jgi:predicted RNA-binding protein with PUA-like domain
MPYLLKSEPDKYSYDDLLRDGETTWDGIANNQALMTLRNMKKGDKLVIYHSNVGKAAVGTAKVVSVAVDATNPKLPFARPPSFRDRSCSASFGCLSCLSRTSNTTGLPSPRPW